MISAAQKIVLLVVVLCSGILLAAEGEKARSIEYPAYPSAPAQQSQAEAMRKSAGCVTCHTDSDATTMHVSGAVVLGCTDCHGGAPDIFAPGGAPTESAYAIARDQAHVQARYPESWHYPSSANPQQSYTLLNRESAEFVRFVNPSDYRVASQACGACHQPIIDELNRLGARKEPVFSTLPREHVLNRSVGILFTKLGSR